MHSSQPSLIARDETFLGVCAGLGEDFGFNPLWLRMAFAVSLLWNPTVVVGTYAAAGVLVLFSRLVFPAPRIAAPAPSAEAERTADTAPAAERPEPEALAIAA